MSHPKKMPFEEEQQLLKIVDKNPNISDRELAELLETKRNPAFLYRKREKLLGKRKISYKNDYSTFFNTDKIIQLNQSDYKSGILIYNSIISAQKRLPRREVFFAYCYSFIRRCKLRNRSR